jgi:O-acetyl-ADP-ribose deacetylase
MPEAPESDLRVDLVRGDITTVEADAIVNAANEELVPGAGVDGAIRRAGGPAITAETARLGRCPTGDAVATTAGDLPARYVIHAVGPRFRGGGAGEDELLVSAHRRAVEVADGLGCRSIAFPALSTGIFGYPPERAAPIAVAAARAAAEASENVREVRFVLFSDDLVDAFAAARPG